MERAGLHGFEDWASFDCSARSYDEIEIGPRQPINLLSLGYILRYAAPKGRGGSLLPPFFGISRREIPESGMASTPTSPGAGKIKSPRRCGEEYDYGKPALSCGRSRRRDVRIDPAICGGKTAPAEAGYRMGVMYAVPDTHDAFSRKPDGDP